MKKLLLLAILLSGQLVPVQPGPAEPAPPKVSHVYVCTGPKAKKYHATDECRGLTRCSGIVKKVRLTYATDTLGMEPCKLCYK